MKRNRNSFVRKLVAAAVVAAAAAAMATAAFAAEGDDGIAGYLPPVENTTQGEIELYAADGQQETVADTAVTAGDGTAAGYLPPMPEDQMIQGDIMMVSAGNETVEKVPLAAGLTMTAPFWKEVLFTARQNGSVLTLDASESTVTVKGTIGDLRAQMARDISTLSVVSEKNSTTLNLTLMCEGYSDHTRFTLRQIGSHTFLTIGGRCRRDLIVGR